MVEATIVINGVVLSYTESMTVRVALSSFMMYLTNEESAKVLGPIADGYRAHLSEVMRILHDPLIAACELWRSRTGTQEVGP